MTAAARLRISLCRFRYSRPGLPASASILRTPAAMLVSWTTTTSPRSPVLCVCVPPHSSRLNPGISTSRTRSPYFSSKSAIAPVLRASSISITRTVRSWFARISAFTSRSISASSSTVTGEKWLKSNRSRSGATSEPACLRGLRVLCAVPHAGYEWLYGGFPYPCAAHVNRQVHGIANMERPGIYLAHVHEKITREV